MRRRRAALGRGARRPRVLAALRFAAEAHHRQMRKDRRTPYVVHPVAVLRILSSELAVTDPGILEAALLHDVLEDTPRRPAELRSRFGHRVTHWVEELTIPHEFHGPGVPDSVKTDLLVRAARRISWTAVLIKFADRVDNLRDSANARWSAKKRQEFRAQTRAILRTVDRRIRQDPPPAAIARALRQARRLLQSELG
jgi:GTP diphosphokinase / guanosine-3',5'-bis(diphosphate) 3'-diphosphatase